MGEVQLWQYEGLGADRDTLEKVLRIFESDGVQGVESQQALSTYIQKLDDSKLREMYEISKETALQLFADCFGVVFAAEKYSKWNNDILRKAIEILQKEKETAEREAEANREGLQKVLNNSREEIDRLQREYSTISYEKEEAEEQIKELQDKLAHYKADLYDFYAKAGKLPDYERR